MSQDLSIGMVEEALLYLRPKVSCILCHCLVKLSLTKYEKKVYESQHGVQLDICLSKIICL